MMTPQVALFAMLLLATPPSDTARQSSDKQHPGEQQHNYSAKPPTTTIKTPVEHATRTAPRDDCPCREKPYLAPWWQRLTADPVAVLTGLILIVYILLFGVGVYQTKAVIKAADAAKEGAAAAVAQGNLAQMDQRAWVAVVGVMHTPLKRNLPFEVGVNIMNSGKTPAKGKTAIRVLMLRVFEKPELKDATWAPMTTRSHGIFFPNALCHIRNYVRAGVEMSALTEADIATINTGFNHVFVDGRIDYVDVFGHPHWTEFRYVWNAVQDVFTECEEGNDTDDKWG